MIQVLASGDDDGVKGMPEMMGGMPPPIGGLMPPPFPFQPGPDMKMINPFLGYGMMPPRPPFDKGFFLKQILFVSQNLIILFLSS